MPSAAAMVSFGRAFFGTAILASGVLQLVIGDFVRLVPKTPGSAMTPSIWAYVVGIALVGAGLAILSGRMAGGGAGIVAALLAIALVSYAPRLIATPGLDRPFLHGFMWTNPLKTLALIGGAAILAARWPEAQRPLSALVRVAGRLAPAGATFLAVFLVVSGVQHFVYNDFVTTMVPSWIPPGQRFWAYLTGAALITGGVGILLPGTARLAARLSALMIFLWVPMLHIPRALAGPNHPGETAGIFEALAISGVALLVAGTWRPRSGAEAGERS